MAQGPDGVGFKSGHRATPSLYAAKDDTESPSLPDVPATEAVKAERTIAEEEAIEVESESPVREG